MLGLAVGERVFPMLVLGAFLVDTGLRGPDGLDRGPETLGPAWVFHGPLPVLGDRPEVIGAVLGRHLSLGFFQRLAGGGFDLGLRLDLGFCRRSLSRGPWLGLCCVLRLGHGFGLWLAYG